MTPLINFALKNLKKSKIRSGLSILAVFLGVLLITTLLVMTDSLVAAVDDSLDLLSGVVVVQQENAVDPNFSLVDVNVINDLELANAPGGALDGMIESMAKEIWYLQRSDTGIFGFIQVIGVLPSAEEQTVGVVSETNLIKGRVITDDDSNATYIGATAAFAMNKDVGDVVEVNNRMIPIVGIFETDSFLDNAMFMPISLVESFSVQFESEEYVSTILLKPTDFSYGDEIKAYVNNILGTNKDNNNDGRPDGYDIEASDFDEIAEQGRQFLDITTEYAFYLGLISIVIGSLSVFNAILMSVMERKKEIAILKATGWSDNEVGLEVFVESVIVAAIGGIGGLLAGTVIAYYFTATSEFLDLTLRPITLVQSYVYAVLLGIFAGLYPAFRAMRIDPVRDLD